MLKGGQDCPFARCPGPYPGRSLQQDHWGPVPGSPQLFIGAEGIGLYQMAYPFTALPLSWRQRYSHCRGETKCRRDSPRPPPCCPADIPAALALLALTGFCFPPPLSAGPVLATKILGDPRALYPLRAIAPAVFLIAIQVALRGYFQGRQKMVPIGGSQVVEQLVRVVTMLGLAYALRPRGLEYAAAGATFGTVTGALAGNLLLGALYLRSPQTVDRHPTGAKEMGAILADIVRLALPITLGAFIMPVMDTVDAVIVPMRLQVIGFSVRQATALYGQLSGMAVSLILFPTVITAAFAFSLIPAISEAVALEREDLVSRLVGEALGVTVLVALPATVGLYLLPAEICQLLFQTPEAGTANFFGLRLLFPLPAADNDGILRDWAGPVPGAEYFPGRLLQCRLKLLLDGDTGPQYQGCRPGDGHRFYGSCPL